MSEGPYEHRVTFDPTAPTLVIEDVPDKPWNDPADMARRVGNVNLSERLAHGWYPSIPNPDNYSVQGHVHDRHVLSIVRTLEATCRDSADEIDRLNARVKELETPPTRAITWKEEPPPLLVYNQPPHPGRCADGPESHVWTMDVEESTISLHCDCQLCDVGMEDWFPEYFFTAEDIPVRIEFFNESYGDDVNVYWHITPATAWLTQAPTTQTEGTNT